jgi:hypothetical protein
MVIVPVPVEKPVEFRLPALDPIVLPSRLEAVVLPKRAVDAAVAGSEARSRVPLISTMRPWMPDGARSGEAVRMRSVVARSLSGLMRQPAAALLRLVAAVERVGLLGAFAIARPKPRDMTDLRGPARAVSM